MFPALLSPLTALLSLSTLAGVIVHDTNIDKATMVAVALPVTIAAYEAGNKVVGSDPHTHPQHIKVQSEGNKRPTMRPRAWDDRKHLQDKDFESGRHLFDNNLYPVI